ncbi:unnamed protein product [Rhizophagus irregularis]|nr:unnamed protein product [Rhizophagus irregularis]
MITKRFLKVDLDTTLLFISQYFYTAFSNGWAEKKDGKFILRKPNISPQLFNIILRFIYCGNIKLNNLQDLDILKLLIAVDEFNIQPLVSHIQEFLIEHKTEFLHQNPTGRFDAKSFHRNCDNKGATIWIAKIQDSTQLIGGYNPLDWNGNYWKNTADSFLFSFTDGKIISTAKLGYVKDASHAVYCGNNQGPSMGGLYCYNSNSWEYDYYYFSSVYHDIGIPTRFKVEDFEIFQVIKKIN